MDIESIFFFLLGLIFGSFFNVVGLRLPNDMPFTNERSNCPRCKHVLTWHENIPLLSFVIQRRKCRHCAEKISYIYPAIELITGILFVISYTIIGLKFDLITALLLISMLMIILVSDMSYMLIPNKVLLFFTPLFIIIRMIDPLTPWWSPIIGTIVGFILLAIIIIVSHGGMGAGDMKLFGLLGVVLGAGKVLLAFFLSCMTGAVIGMLLLLFKRIQKGQPVPFGPYIVIATLITYFFGDYLLYWYFSLF